MRAIDAGRGFTVHQHALNTLRIRGVGQAMGLNVFTLFTGFGLGSLLFGAALSLGFGPALALFSAVQFGAAVVALEVFRAETPQRSQARLRG